jgi:peptide/nickel transport system substrate-binding protein
MMRPRDVYTLAAVFSLIALLAFGGVSGAAERPKQGGILKVALDADVKGLDIQATAGKEPRWVLEHVHNNIVTITPDFQLVPELAERWTVADDGLSITFELRQGVKFHDGTPWNAEAFKFNIERVLDPQTKSPYRQLIEPINGAQAIDEYRAKVTLARPYRNILMALASYRNGLYMVSPAAVKQWGKDYQLHPVGTGPFVFKEWVAHSHITLERNPHYFKQGLPHLDGVQLRVVTDPIARITALRTGELDVINELPPAMVQIMEKFPGARIDTGPELSFIYAVFDLEAPPFNDVRVRKAVAGYGIDRADIAKRAFFGRATPLVSVVPPGSPDYLDLNEMYPYDPNRAKGLLKEAGYGPGKPLTYTLLIDNSSPLFSDIATILKEQLKRIGVDVKVEMVDRVTRISRIAKALGEPRDYHQVISAASTRVALDQNAYVMVTDASWNVANNADKKVDELYAQWGLTLDETKARKIAEELQRYVADNLVWVNLTGAPFFQVARTYVKDLPFYNQVKLRYETVWLDK